MRKLRQVLIISLIIISLLCCSITQSAYKEKVSGEASIEVAEPIIRMIESEEVNIENLTLEPESIHFSVCNYDEDDNITEVWLYYYITLNLSQENAPIIIKLYEIDENGNEKQVMMTNYKMDNAKSFTTEGKQIHNYRLDIVYNPDSNVELEENFAISIDLEAIQGRILDGKEDTIKPEIAKLSTTEANDNGNTFTIVAEDKESGVAKIELYIKDTLYKTYNYSDYQTSKKETIDVSVWDLPFYEDAYVVVTDYYGNTTTSEKVKPNTSRIRNKVDMYKFSEVVNGTDTFSGKTVYLLQNVDLEGSETNQWIPIGDYGTNTGYYFAGTFEGNNHTISGVYINNTKDYQGLFGYVKNGKIIGIVIDDDATIMASSYVGAIAASISDTTILNCGNNSNIKALNRFIGGIVGVSKTSEIIGTYNTGDISSDNIDVGGIVGFMSTSTSDNVIKYSYNTGNITAYYRLGGIVGNGSNYTKIYNCYNIGNITATATSSSDMNAMVGGIAGRIRGNGLVTYCYNLGTVVSNEQGGIGIGGIAGTNESYNGSDYIEFNSSIISYCYNLANVTGNGASVGGIVGHNVQYCYVENCYIKDSITVTYSSTTATNNIGSYPNYVGRIVGRDFSTYVNNIGVLESIPTVYYVVNGLNDGTSQYWSNNNVYEPILAWQK